jgi:hypothetical protein
MMQCISWCPFKHLCGFSWCLSKHLCGFSWCPSKHLCGYSWCPSKHLCGYSWCQEALNGSVRNFAEHWQALGDAHIKKRRLQKAATIRAVAKGRRVIAATTSGASMERYEHVVGLPARTAQAITPYCIPSCVFDPFRRCCRVSVPLSTQYSLSRLTTQGHVFNTSENGPLQCCILHANPHTLHFMASVAVATRMAERHDTELSCSRAWMPRNSHFFCG